MITSRGLTRISALAVVALLSAACSGSPEAGSGSALNSPGPTSSRPSSSGSATSTTPSAGPTTPGATASPSSFATATKPATTAAVAAPRRTGDDLKKALISIDDLPSGWSVETGSGDGGDQPSSSTTNPRCTELNAILNANDLAGSRAHATTSFSGGGDGPFVSQRIDSLGSTTAATQAVQKIRTATTGCDAVTLRLPGQGSSKMRISQVSAPRVGGQPYALRLAASGGALQGLEVTFFWAPVGDVVLSLNLINAAPEDFDGIVTDAHTKLTDVLKVSAQTT